MELYDFAPSGNCYKIRLLLSMLGLEYRRLTVNSAAGETLTRDFLRLNPRGQIPVLRDDGEVIWDSMAILVYLARRYGDSRWLPADALGEARVMQWLALSENELLYGLARARAVLRFGRLFDLAQCQKEGTWGLKVMDEHLLGREWLAAGQATIADIACYPYAALAEEGEIPLAGYPNVRGWIERFEALPGYVPLEA